MTVGKIDTHAGFEPGERASILGSLAQRLQESVRATIEALGQSHAHQLAAIVESSGDAIISTNLEGIIVTWNRGAETLFGYAAEEVVGKPTTILIPADRQDEGSGIIERIRGGDRFEHYETAKQRKDGRRIDVSLTVSPIMDAAGNVVGASRIARDITRQKRAEETEATLYQFTDRLFRAESVNDVYEAALAAIVRALDCDRASILMFDHNGEMKFVAWRGLSDAYRYAVEGHSPWTQESKDPQAIFIDDVERAELEATLKENVTKEGISALAFIPLIAKGELIGKFMAYHSTPHVFNEREVELAVTIARQLGFSVERMRAEGARELLVNETIHRIKNTLATVQAIAGQTLKETAPGEREAFLARLRALGEAHDLLTNQNWDHAPLRDVVGLALKPFDTSGHERFTVEGPIVSVPAQVSLILTMGLHELATNAVKYGALSNGDGKVVVVWEIIGQSIEKKLRLSWQEMAGPPVSVPERKGFGSLLIQQGFSGFGETRLDFRPDGLRCSLDISLTNR